MHVLSTRLSPCLRSAAERELSDGQIVWRRPLALQDWHIANGDHPRGQWDTVSHELPGVPLHLWGIKVGARAFSVCLAKVM
jgi:hypothetical protein